MVDSSYDQAISSAKTQVGQHQKRTEDLTSKYDEVVNRFLVEWASYLKDRALRDKPEVAKELGSEKLGRMKSAFNELIESYTDIVPDALKDEVFWPHREQLPDDLQTNTMVSYELEQQHKGSVDQAIKNLIGRVGVILAQYGFVEPGADREWNLAGEGKLTYAYAIGVYSLESGNDLDEVRKKYAEETKELVKAESELRNAEHAKKAAEAKDLWDKA